MFDGPEGRLADASGCLEGCSPVHGDLLRRRIGRCHGISGGIQNLPAHRGCFGGLAFIDDAGAERKRRGTAVDLGADGALPPAQVQRIRFRQPHVAVDPGALVEPAGAIARVDAGDDAVFGADGKEVGDVEAEGGVGVVVAPDEAPVDKEEDVAKGAVELDGDAAAGVAGWDQELAPVPAHAGLRIAPAQRLVPMRLQLVVVNEGQLHGPVVGQVQRAPFRVVVTHARELEVARLGEGILVDREIHILVRVASVAELELPAKVEKELLARGHDRQCANSCSLRRCGEQSGGARPCRLSDERGCGERHTGTKQIAAGDWRHRRPLSHGRFAPDQSPS